MWSVVLLLRRSPVGSPPHPPQIGRGMFLINFFLWEYSCLFIFQGGTDTFVSSSLLLSCLLFVYLFNRFLFLKRYSSSSHNTFPTLDKLRTTSSKMNNRATVLHFSSTRTGEGQWFIRLACGIHSRCTSGTTTFILILQWGLGDYKHYPSLFAATLFALFC